MVTEKINGTLADELARRSLSRREIEQLTADVVRGLSALHRNGLVYMNLSPESINATNNGWILNQQTAARIAGKMDVAETRPLLGRSGYVPPEAYGGDVSPAWDVWSLGVLVRRAFQGNSPRPSGAGRAARQQPLPPPFEDVVRESMRPNPAERASLSEIAAVLNVKLDDAAREPAAAQAEPTAEVSPATQVSEESEAWPIDRDEATRARAHEVVAARREASLRAAQEDDERMALGGRPKTNGTKWVAATVSFLLAIGILAYLESTKKTEKDGEEARLESETAARQSNPVPMAVETQDPVPALVASPATPPEPKPAETESKVAEDSPAADSAPVDPAERKAAIDRVIEEWVGGIRSRNVRGQADSYAPQVTRYLGSTNLTRSQVLQKKEILFRQMKTVRSLRVSDVEIERLTDDHAVVSFRKEWDFNGRFFGSERQRLGLVWNGTRWQIEREEVVAAAGAKGRKS